MAISGFLNIYPSRSIWSLKFQRLMQFRVVGFGFLQDGNVGVGIFPQCEEIFVGAERPDASGIGSRSSRLQRIRASYSQTCHLPSSSSTRFRCGREFSETPQQQPGLVRLRGTLLRAHTRGRGRKYWRRTESIPTRWGSSLQGIQGGSWVLVVQRHVVNRADVGMIRAEAACASRSKRASAYASRATSSGRNFSATKR